MENATRFWLWFCLCLCLRLRLWLRRRLPLTFVPLLGCHFHSNWLHSGGNSGCCLVNCGNCAKSKSHQQCIFCMRIATNSKIKKILWLQLGKFPSSSHAPSDSRGSTHTIANKMLVASVQANWYFYHIHLGENAQVSYLAITNRKRECVSVCVCVWYVWARLMTVPCMHTVYTNVPMG